MIPNRPTQTQACCSDYVRATSLSRRRFLGGVAAASTATVSTSLFGQAVRQSSFAATTGGNVLVVLSFRGGIDGMGMVVPHGDPGYYKARPKIGIPKTSLLATDAMFGLHPQLAPLQWLWDGGEMAAVQAVGMAVPNRSHFVSMELIEDADPGSSLRQGWVNRMIGLDGDGSAVDAVHLGDAMPPTLVSGPQPTLASKGLDLTLSGTANGWGPRRNNQLNMVWSGASGRLGSVARSALEAVGTLAPVAAAKYAPTVAYPTAQPATDLAAALEDTAQLIKADIGTEVVSVDFGSWDMHDGYGNLGSGDMVSMTGAFAASVNAFMRDLGALRSKVTLVTISEFGRRTVENGNHGLDHGWGNMMLVMGGGVRGGRYYGNWPGLTTTLDSDLAVTTDYRQVLGEVVHRRFPDKDVTKVFPGLSYAPLGVMV